MLVAKEQLELGGKPNVRRILLDRNRNRGALTLVAVFVLAACGGDDGPTQTQTATLEDGTTVTIETPRDSADVEAEQEAADQALAEREAYEEAVAQYDHIEGFDYSANGIAPAYLGVEHPEAHPWHNYPEVGHSDIESELLASPNEVYVMSPAEIADLIRLDVDVNAYDSRDEAYEALLNSYVASVNTLKATATKFMFDFDIRDHIDSIITDRPPSENPHLAGDTGVAIRDTIAEEVRRDRAFTVVGYQLDHDTMMMSDMQVVWSRANERTDPSRTGTFTGEVIIERRNTLGARPDGKQSIAEFGTTELEVFDNLYDGIGSTEDTLMLFLIQPDGSWKLNNYNYHHVVS